MSKIICKNNYVSRKDKHQKTTKLFVCECGKEYIGFTSLYLHFQKKHNGNISTKKGCKNRKVQKTIGKTIYTYYYSKGSFKPCPKNESSSERDNITQNMEQTFCSSAFQLAKDIINQFLASQYVSKSKSRMESSPNQIILEFLDFLKQLLSDQSDKFIKKFQIWHLPYFFNPFINEKKEKMGCTLQNLEVKYACMTLHSLAKWLEKRNYTQLVVRCDLWNTQM